MDIGTQKQLFIDGRFFQHSEGIELCMNPPVQDPDPVLIADQPWEEKGIGAYSTAFRESDGRFRLWYDALMDVGTPQESGPPAMFMPSQKMASNGKNRPSVSSPLAAPPRTTSLPLSLNVRVCRAPTVYRDETRPRLTNATKLWEQVSSPLTPQIAEGTRGGLWAMHSPDGIHWQTYPNQPNPPNQSCDTQNMFFLGTRPSNATSVTHGLEKPKVSDEAALAGPSRLPEYWPHYLARFPHLVKHPDRPRSR